MKKMPVLAALFLSLAFHLPNAVHAESARAEDASSGDTIQIAPTQYISFQTLDIGTSSGCARPAKMLITDEKEWERVWQMHSQPREMKLSVPQIDFSRQAVIALLMGNQPGNTYATVVQIIRGSTDTTIYYEEYGGQKSAPNQTQAFHFAVIDKPVNRVRFADANAECAACVVR